MDDNKTQQQNEYTANNTCSYYVTKCSWQCQWECMKGRDRWN